MIAVSVGKIVLENGELWSGIVDTSRLCDIFCNVILTVEVVSYVSCDTMRFYRILIICDIEPLVLFVIECLDTSGCCRLILVRPQREHPGGPALKHPKRFTVCALLGGLVLAVGTASYAEHAVCGTASSLLHVPALFRVQLLTYLLCAALWLPWRAHRAATVGAVVSGLLLVATVALYVPVLWRPDAFGFCEGFSFVGIIAVYGINIALVLGSIVALSVL